MSHSKKKGNKDEEEFEEISLAKLPKSKIIDPDQAIIDEEFARGLVNFSLRLLAKMQQLQEKENFGFSPFTLLTCLGLLTSGAKGGTAKEIIKTLGLPADDVHKSLNENCRKLVDFYVLMLSFSNKYEIHYINKILRSKGTKPSKDFESAARKYYGSHIELFDFSSKTAADDVNLWVKGQTKNKVDSVVKKLDEHTNMVIINVLCCNIKVQHKFGLKKQTFFNHGDKKNKTEIESLCGNIEANYGEVKLGDCTFQVLQLSCDADLTLFFVLPRNPSELSALVNMSATDFKQMSKATQKQQVNARIPKLDHQSFTSHLTQPLKALGIKEAFDKKHADFSGIDTSEKLHLSDVIHTVKMECSVQDPEKSEEKKDATKFHVEHPFMFILRDIGNDITLVIAKVLTFK